MALRLGHVLTFKLTYCMKSLLTDDNLNVITKDGKIDPDVWAIGDAAIIKTAVLPATAQGRYPFSNHAPMGYGFRF